MTDDAGEVHRQRVADQAARVRELQQRRAETGRELDAALDALRESLRLVGVSDGVLRALVERP